MAPETPLHLDEYYNGLKGINKRKYSYTEKPKSFKQSLKDMFFPQIRNPSRKIVKVKKPNPYSSTLKPFNFKFPSQKKTEDLFPYKFLKPIQNPNYRYIEEVPRSTIAKTIDIENKIDKQLVSPTDPEVDLQGRGLLITRASLDLDLDLDRYLVQMIIVITCRSGVSVSASSDECGSRSGGGSAHCPHLLGEHDQRGAGAQAQVGQAGGQHCLR